MLQKTLPTHWERLPAKPKRLKDYTLGFDELNIIKPDINTGNDHDGGSTAGIGGIDSGLDLSDYDYDFLGDAKSNVDSIIGGIRAWAGEMKEKLAPQLKYADDVFKRIGDFFRNSQWGSFGGFFTVDVFLYRRICRKVWLIEFRRFFHHVFRAG